MRKLAWLGTWLLLALPSAASAQQFRVSGGAGIAYEGTTGESFAQLRPVQLLMGELTVPVAGLAGIGLEGNYWTHNTTQGAFFTGVVLFHVPDTPLKLEVGVGYGGGHPTGEGSVGGLGGQLGLDYDIKIPTAPFYITVFTDAFFAHGHPDNLQMFTAGLAITWR